MKNCFKDWSQFNSLGKQAALVLVSLRFFAGSLQQCDKAKWKNMCGSGLTLKKKGR